MLEAAGGGQVEGHALLDLSVPYEEESLNSNFVGCAWAVVLRDGSWMAVSTLMVIVIVTMIIRTVTWLPSAPRNVPL